VPADGSDVKGIFTNKVIVLWMWRYLALENGFSLSKSQKLERTQKTSNIGFPMI
jgi:hypothetical protein